MRALVTGAAGFIGSHLVERLAEQGNYVRAVDCLTHYYDVAQKQANLESFARLEDCEVVMADLRTCDLRALLKGVDCVFHQAGQPGVRASWDSGFASYVEHNISVTQRLLEAARETRPKRFVFASSSSVYGDASRYPTEEYDLLSPQSPYGVTKLAAENLCGVYARNWGVATVSLRYFTVYGPRQRPDMAMHRLIEAVIVGETFPVYGDGNQIRDFTYVRDVVDANVLAATAEVPPGAVMNIAGGTSTTLLEVIEVLQSLIGRPVELEWLPDQPGDVRRTGGSTEIASRLLGWHPRVELGDGLARQLDWHVERRLERLALA